MLTFSTSALYKHACACPRVHVCVLSHSSINTVCCFACTPAAPFRRRKLPLCVFEWQSVYVAWFTAHWLKSSLWIITPSSASAAALLISFERYFEGALLKPVRLKVSPGAIILNYLNFETHLTLSSNSVIQRWEKERKCCGETGPGEMR